MGQSKFTISLLGFDQRSADMLAEATSKTMRIVEPVSKDDTQVVVVDIDGPEGIAIWDEFRQQWPHMPAVVASENDPEIDDISFAEKPFTAEELIDNITEAMILAPTIEETPEAADDSTAPVNESLQEMEAALGVSKNTEQDIDEADEPVLEAITAPEEIVDEEIAADDSTAPVNASLQEMEAALGVSKNTEQDIDEAMYGSKSNDEADEPVLEAITKPEEIVDKEIDETQAEPEPDETEAEVAEAKEKEDEILEEPVPDKELPPLSQIAGILSSHTSTNSDSTIRKLDTPNPDESYFDPNAHIIGLVLKGIAEGEKTGAIAKMACLLDRAILVDAKNKLVHSNLKDIHMRQIAIAPLGKGENGLDTELEMIENESIEDLVDTDSSVYSMETFVWELAVLTSKGRAPKGTTMDEPTYLMQWPNFTRLMTVPYAMKASAYWLNLPSSLHDLSENLDIPLCDILSLYSATSLTGLAGPAKRHSDKMLRPGKPEKHEKRNLFGAIMGSLKKN